MRSTGCASDTSSQANSPDSPAVTSDGGHASADKPLTTDQFEGDAQVLRLRWVTQITRAGAALILIFEAGYLWSDLTLISSNVFALIIPHLFNIGASVALIVLASTKWLLRHWRAVALATAGGVLASTAAISAVDGYYAPLYISATFIMMGTAALLPWSAGWQLAITLLSASAMVTSGIIRTNDLHRAQHWVAFGIAAIVAYLTVKAGQHHREALHQRNLLLQDQHQRLIAQAAQREATLAEREQTLEQLRQSEAKLRKIFEAAPDSIWIKRLADGAYVDLNSALGYTRDEAFASNTLKLGLWPKPTQRQEFVQRVQADGSVHDMEVVLRAKDGVERPYLLSASLVQLNGEPHAVCFGRDISAIKENERALTVAREELKAQVAALQEKDASLRATIAMREGEIERRIESERRLAESETTLRKIFEASLDAIAIARLDDGRLIDVNAELCRISGYAREEMIGRSPQELGMWADEDTLRRAVNELRTRGFIRNLEFTPRYRSDEKKPYLFNAVVVELAGEKCIVGVTRDISKLKETERELVEAREAALAASAAKSEFLAMMSHEIRTPMNAVLGMAELLSETPLNADQQRYVDTMRANGNALLDLISGILDLAKVESGRLSLETSDFDLGDLIEKVVDALAIRAHEKKLEIAARLLPGVPSMVAGDPLRLRQILVNLIGNAIKFTEHGEVVLTVEAVAAPSVPRGGESTVRERSGRSYAQWLRFSVADTGIGVAPAQREAIFASFTQADSSLARRYSGSGLGLAIVKRLVDLMGGDTSIRSTLGQGSEFTFSVPLQAIRATTSVPLGTDADSDRNGFGERSRISPPEFQPMRGLRVLVVDETVANRDNLREWLEGWGAEIDQAADGGKALAQYERAMDQQNAYDIVMLDWRLPTIDAMTVAREMLVEKAGRVGSRCTIIPMIATDELNSVVETLRKSGMPAGVNASYLAKPLRKTDLLRVITQARGLDISSNDVMPSSRVPDGADATQAHFSTGDVGADVIGLVAETGRPLRILLAEDSFDNRLLIEAYLKKLNCLIEFAENGALAVERAKSNEYDLVLMDIQMPVMDGYTAVRTIRRWEAERGRQPVPIVALTAAALNDAVHESFAAGCDAHVTKPVAKATLIEAIKHVVETRRAQREIAVGRGGTKPTERHLKTIVRVDPELSDLVPGFLENKRDDADRIVAATEAEDYEQLSRIGHRIKGEGGSFGFDPISIIGVEVERGAKARDLAALRHCAEQLRNYVNSVEVVFE